MPSSSAASNVWSESDVPSARTITCVTPMSLSLVCIVWFTPLSPLRSAWSTRRQLACTSAIAARSRAAFCPEVSEVLVILSWSISGRTASRGSLKTPTASRKSISSHFSILDLTSSSASPILVTTSSPVSLS